MALSIEAVRARCPYCAEPVELLVDPSVASQSYIEDCEVCCRPMSVQVAVDESGRCAVSLYDEDAVNGH